MACPGSHLLHGHVVFGGGPRDGEEVAWVEGEPFPAGEGYRFDWEESHKEACGGLCLHARYAAS